MLKQEASNKLTQREMEIFQLIVEGKSNKHIASTLAITIRTVKFHTGNIYLKLGFHCRSEAIVWAWQNHNLDRPKER